MNSLLCINCNKPVTSENTILLINQNNPLQNGSIHTICNTRWDVKRQVFRCTECGRYYPQGYTCICSIPSLISKSL
jgi:hypothetical protein